MPRVPRRGIDHGSRRRPSEGCGIGAAPVVATTDDVPEIEPDSWSDLIEFRDQFSDDYTFGVLADPGDGLDGFWIVRDIEKVRSAAVPIDQPATFDMVVPGPTGKIVNGLRFTIEEINHVLATEPSDRI